MGRGARADQRRLVHGPGHQWSDPPRRHRAGLGGFLAAGLNLVLTPLLPIGSGTAVVAASTPFGIRMPLAAASVALVTLGSVGLYLAQAHRLRFGSIAFLIAGFGGMTAFWCEVVQFTLVRDLAFNAPDTLTRLEEAGQLGGKTAPETTQSA